MTDRRNPTRLFLGQRAVHRLVKEKLRNRLVDNKQISRFVRRIVWRLGYGFDSSDRKSPQSIRYCSMGSGQDNSLLIKSADQVRILSVSLRSVQPTDPAG